MLESPAAASAAGSPVSTGAGDSPAGGAGANGTPAVPAVPAGGQPAGGGSPTSPSPAATPAPAGSPGPSRNADGTFAAGKKDKSKLSPIPELPGVFDSSELAREGDEPVDPAAAAAAGASADGSVAPTPPPAPPPAPGAEAAQPGQPATPPVAQRFVFGGAEFTSREHAEQSFKTLRGQYRSMETRTNEAVGHANRAVDAAIAWQRYANELEGRLNGAAPANGPANGHAPAGQPATAGAKKADGIDFRFYRQLHEEHGEVIANIWLQEQTDNAVQAKIEAALEARMAEVTPFIERERTRQDLVRLFTEVQSYVDPVDGSPAYPELNDAKSAEAIMLLLPHIGLTPEQAKTPKGVHLAVVTYRDQVSRARRGQPAVPAPSAAPSAAAPTVATPNAAALAAATAAAAAVASGVQPPVMQPAGAGGSGSTAAQIRNAHDLRIGEGLGFSFD